MKSKKNDSKRLEEWKEKIAADESAWESEVSLMAEREAIYQGRNTVNPVIDGDDAKDTPHVRNIAAELIECQVSSSIPAPKVTAMHPEDEELAVLIEDMIRNKLDKLPIEAINDQTERTVPIQGGAMLQYEWDNTKGTHTTVGEGRISFRHPKQIVPQAGVTSAIEDMDRFTLKTPQTKEYIKRRYGVDVSEESEEDSALRSADGSSGEADDMVTQYSVYYRNENGGIGLISWVRDTILEDLPDYQARRLRRCGSCGAQEPLCDVDSVSPTYDGTPSGDGKSKASKRGRDQCPYCGGTFEEYDEGFFPFINTVPFELPDGTAVANGEMLPYFKPNIYPVFLQRNVSSFGKLLGDSDIDKIKTQQNSINRLYAKMMTQLLNAGSYITLPDRVSIKKDSKDGKVLRVSAADKALIGVYDLSCDISQSLALIDRIYEESQQLIGVTDSFLGRRDTTATSGKAKEFSAAQAAGRLESKRVMKNFMYSQLFEAIFLFELAYADEPRPVIGRDSLGNARRQTWDKYLFLKKDAAETFYWNTDFLFSTDSIAPLAQNREAMWQETRSHFESGAIGDPTQTATQIAYWGLMETLHYPGAGEMKRLLEETQKKQTEMQLAGAQAEKEAMEYAQQAVPDVPPMDAGAMAPPPEAEMMPQEPIMPQPAEDMSGMI